MQAGKEWMVSNKFLVGRACCPQNCILLCQPNEPKVKGRSKAGIEKVKMMRTTRHDGTCCRVGGSKGWCASQGANSVGNKRCGAAAGAKDLKVAEALAMPSMVALVGVTGPMGAKVTLGPAWATRLVHWREADTVVPAWQERAKAQLPLRGSCENHGCA